MYEELEKDAPPKQDGAERIPRISRRCTVSRPTLEKLTRDRPVKITRCGGAAMGKQEEPSLRHYASNSGVEKRLFSKRDR